MFEIKVTVTLAPEVLELIGRLINGQAQSVKKANATTKGKVIDYPKQTTPETTNDKDTGGITMEDLRSIAKGLLQSSTKREALKLILAEMGLRKVTDVEEKDFEDMHSKLLILKEG